MGFWVEKTPSPIPQTPPKPRVSLYLSESLPLDLWLHLDLGSMWSKEQCNINVCAWEYLSMCVFMMYVVYMSKYVRLSEFVLKQTSLLIQQELIFVLCDHLLQYLCLYVCHTQLRVVSELVLICRSMHMGGVVFQMRECVWLFPLNWLVFHLQPSL